MRNTTDIILDVDHERFGFVLLQTRQYTTYRGTKKEVVLLFFCLCHALLLCDYMMDAVHSLYEAYVYLPSYLCGAISIVLSNIRKCYAMHIKSVFFSLSLYFTSFNGYPLWLHSTRRLEYKCIFSLFLFVELMSIFYVCVFLFN